MALRTPQDLGKIQYVTGSAKTEHSFNLQYKALNTLGAYLCIVKKFHKFLERFFLSERRV